MLQYPILSGKNDNEYTFDTASQVAYEVVFKPSPYLFDEGSAFSRHVVELVIRISKDSVNQRPGLDKLVAPTIASIITDYYQIRHETVALYICDSSDGKQAARKRKFDDWFRYFNQDDFLKHDLPITDLNDGVTYYNAIILRVDNSYRDEIIAEFEAVFGRYNDPK